MTTEKKYPTVEDVDRWFKMSAQSAGHKDGSAPGSLACLRDLALLGVQVPGLLADNAALLSLLRTWARKDPAVTPTDVLSAIEWVALNGSPGAALLAEHKAKVSALQARVTELEGANERLADGLANASEDADACRGILRAALHNEPVKDALAATVAQAYASETQQDAAHVRVAVARLRERVEHSEAERDALRAQVEVQRTALERIVAWTAFPRVPDLDDDSKTVSYGFAYGSNGERDYMRDVARVALSTPPGEGES